MMSLNLDLPTSDLAEMHNGILAENLSIRPVNRWGKFTEYSIKLKAHEVAGIIGRPVFGNAAWRLVFGMEWNGDEPANTIDVQRAEGPRWYSAFIGLIDYERDKPTPEEAAIIERAHTWLREHHPAAAETLVRIDGELLWRQCSDP